MFVLIVVVAVLSVWRRKLSAMIVGWANIQRANAKKPLLSFKLVTNPILKLTGEKDDL